METAQSYRATIPPVPAGVARPLWSVMIPTYNCARYLRETLASVLAQDPGPGQMQIEVVDDCSARDDPEAVVRELGGDRVGFYRQPQNVGHVRNFETCLLRARGHLVHILHGDDLVRPGFYARLQEAFASHPEIGAAFCRQIFIDEEGRWESIGSPEQETSGILADWLPRIVRSQRIQTPSIVVRRAVYERLGGFDRRIRYYGEDWEMWIRLAVHYPVWYEVEPLALYRMHRVSLTGQSRRIGGDIRDMRQMIAIVRSYLAAHLPEATVAALLRATSDYVALRAIDTAQWMLGERNVRAAAVQLREALACSHSPRVLRRLFRLVAWLGPAATRRAAGKVLPSLRRRPFPAPAVLPAGDPPRAGEGTR
jgi:hypothetical protein